MNISKSLQQYDVFRGQGLISGYLPLRDLAPDLKREVLVVPLQ
jgi:hypothetical protein